MGYDHELRCVHGAVDVVSDWNGEAQRQLKQRALRRRRELFPLDALSHEPDAGTVGDDGDEPALESRSQPFSDENEPDGRTNRNDGCGDGIDRRELRSLPRGGYRSDDMAGSADAVLWR